MNPALSPAEIEILQMKADGATHAFIATHRGSSESTIRTQCDAILKKLGADNLYHAIALAFRRGILT